MRHSSIDPDRLRYLVERDGLLLGMLPGSNRPVHLGLERLATGVHVIGPSESGKTRALLAIVEQLAVLDVPVFIFNPKGALGAMVRDFCIDQGLVDRLRLFDPSDPELLPGFDPLRPNGLSIATQAKAVRDALLAGHGQTDFDNTQQLARHLFLALYTARELCLTLVEAASILRAGSRLRRRSLSELTDPFMREALEHFDRLRPERQDQLAASTLARLETATTDPLLRRIFTQPNCLDVGELIRCRNIFVADIRQCQPLRPADVKFLGRLLINDVLAHVFARPERDPVPVYLIIDEAELFATEDLCRAFDQGRELGLRTIIAHQHLEQLTLEGGDRRLRVSVDTDLRTKIVFGGLPVSQLEELVPDLFLDQFDPLAVKAELTTLECEPVETMRASFTLSSGGSTGRTQTQSSGHTEGDARSVAHTLAWSRGRSQSRSIGHSVSTGEGEFATSGNGAGMTSSTTVLPDGTVVSSDALSQIMQTGSGQSFVTTATDSESQTQGVSEAFTEGETWSQSRSAARTTGESAAHSVARNSSFAVTLQPFHEYRKRRVPSSRTFWTEQEFLTERVKDLRKLPCRFFVLKVPTKQAVCVRTPSVAEPEVEAAALAAARAHLASFVSYSGPPVPATDVRLVDYKQLPNGEDDHTITVPRRRAPRPGS